MFLKLLSIILLSSAIASRIIVIDDQDLPKLLESLQNSSTDSRFRKLSEVADTGADDQKPEVMELLEEDNTPEVMEPLEEDNTPETQEPLEEDNTSEKVKPVEDDETPEIMEPLEEDNTPETQEPVEDNVEEKVEPVEDDVEENSEESGKFEEPLKESTGEPPFMPLICYYRGGSRPGFEMDGVKYVMRPGQTDDCQKPKEYEVDREVLVTDDVDLSTCGGIPYKYKKNEEEVTDVLYVVKTSGEAETLPEVYPGYMSKAKNNVRIFMYNSVYNYRKWMGSVYVLCMK